MRTVKIYNKNRNKIEKETNFKYLRQIIHVPQRHYTKYIFARIRTAWSCFGKKNILQGKQLPTSPENKKWTSVPYQQLPMPARHHL